MLFLDYSEYRDKKETDVSIQSLCLSNRTVMYSIHDHSQDFTVMQLRKIVSDPQAVILSPSRFFFPLILGGFVLLRLLTEHLQTVKCFGKQFWKPVS